MLTRNLRLKVEFVWKGGSSTYGGIVVSRGESEEDRRRKEAHASTVESSSKQDG